MKNNELLLETIGEIDEKLVPELDSEAKRKSISIKRIAVIGAAAAAVTALVCVTLPMLSRNNNKPKHEFIDTGEREIFEGKEKISPELDNGAMGMGFEGLMAYDISELDEPSVWAEEMEIEHLPVYRNTALDAEIPEEYQRERAERIALALGTEITEKRSDEGYICDDGTEITVYGGQIRVLFSPAKKLPAGMSFTHSHTSKAEAMMTLNNLADSYSDVLGYSNAKTWTYADRTYAGTETRHYYICEETEDTVQGMLNMNLSSSYFGPDDGGDLMVIWIDERLSFSEYMGDYPVIAADEARDKLINGGYISTVPEDYLKAGRIAEDDIAKTDLVYYNSSRAKYYQPYYKFYIELDGTKLNMDNELKNYGIFYVPAVSGEYFENEITMN